jgi:hypothetical protein
LLFCLSVSLCLSSSLCLSLLAIDDGFMSSLRFVARGEKKFERKRQRLGANE